MEEEIQLKLAEVMMDYYIDGNGQSLQDYIIDQCNKSEDGIFSVGDGMFSTVDGELSYTDSKGNTSIISIGNNGEVTIEGGVSSDGSINDDKAPSVSVTSTTNSITFVAKDILAGVAGWNYSTTNSEPTTWNEVLPAQKSFTHTINNLPDNTTYYIWAKDANGNVSTGREIKTKDFDEFLYEVSWENATATITVNSPSTGVQFKTSPEGVWEDYSASNHPKAASGATVYFQVTDGTNVKAFASVKPLKTSTITYDANGGTGNVPNAQTATHMENITVENNNTLSKTGYHFLGWALTNNATSAITNFEMPAQDVTLYAVWQEIEITLGKTLETIDAGDRNLDKTKLTVNITPATANVKLTWTSSDPSIATVDQMGNVIGISCGRATITVSDGKHTAIAQILVNEYLQLYGDLKTAKTGGFSFYRNGTTPDYDEHHTTSGLYANVNFYDNTASWVSNNRVDMSKVAKIDFGYTLRGNYVGLSMYLKTGLSNTKNANDDFTIADGVTKNVVKNYENIEGVIQVWPGEVNSGYLKVFMSRGREIDTCTSWNTVKYIKVYPK